MKCSASGKLRCVFGINTTWKQAVGLTRFRRQFARFVRRDASVFPVGFGLACLFMPAVVCRALEFSKSPYHALTGCSRGRLRHRCCNASCSLEARERSAGASLL